MGWVITIYSRYRLGSSLAGLNSSDLKVSNYFEDSTKLSLLNSDLKSARALWIFSRFKIMCFELISSLLSPYLLSNFWLVWDSSLGFSYFNTLIISSVPEIIYRFEFLSCLIDFLGFSFSFTGLFCSLIIIYLWFWLSKWLNSRKTAKISLEFMIPSLLKSQKANAITDQALSLTSFISSNMPE